MAQEIKYIPIRQSLSSDIENLEPQRQKKKFTKKDILFYISLFTNLALATTCLVLLSTLGDQKHINAFGIDTSFSTQLPWRKRTRYHTGRPKDTSNVTAAWNALVPEHGIVALDHHLAEQRGLPKSMSLPSQPSKGIYIMEAYHQLHCVVTIRRAFYDLLAGREPPFQYPMEHYGHCFDAVRQSIICNPSEHLLYSWGEFDVNITQMRTCRSWNKLRDWATAHTACDPGDVEGLNRIIPNRLCTDGKDGLVVE